MVVLGGSLTSSLSFKATDNLNGTKISCQHQSMEKNEIEVIIPPSKIYSGTLLFQASELQPPRITAKSSGTD